LFTGEVDDNRTDRLGRTPFTQEAFDRLGEFLGSQIARTSLHRDSCAAPTNPSRSADLADYLAGLKVHVQLAPADVADRAKLDRILRMAADFSLKGEKRDMSEDVIDRLQATGCCMRIVVSDRLSNYGLSGVLAYRVTTDALVVEAMALTLFSGSRSSSRSFRL
jgi:predicted enzyme involved in methoxymalonyl-ACP biosynthesis